MGLLTGEFENTLDDKGRLSLPSRLRGELTDNVLILTKGVDDCVWLFPSEQWKSFSQNLMEKTPQLPSRSQIIKRHIIGPAQEVEIDKAGRIAIPQSLRKYAGLNRECVILGIDKYIEIWDADQYRAYWVKNEEEFKVAAEELDSIFL